MSVNKYIQCRNYPALGHAYKQSICVSKKTLKITVFSTLTISVLSNNYARPDGTVEQCLGFHYQVVLLGQPQLESSPCFARCYHEMVYRHSTVLLRTFFCYLSSEERWINSLTLYYLEKNIQEETDARLLYYSLK